MRRSRFTASYTRRNSNTVEKNVFLAYSATSLRTSLEARGWLVLSVTRGDYRPRVPAQARGVSPGSPERWSFNMPAIRTAFEAMTGKTLPSDVEFAYGRANAHRRGVFEWAYHDIGRGVTITRKVLRVRRNLDPVQANRTLWHELAHLAQYVRCPDDAAFIREHKAERAARHGYRNRPCEVEAREWEALAETDNLLNIYGGGR